METHTGGGMVAYDHHLGHSLSPREQVRVMFIRGGEYDRDVALAPVLQWGLQSQRSDQFINGRSDSIPGEYYHVQGSFTRDAGIRRLGDNLSRFLSETSGLQACDRGRSVLQYKHITKECYH